MQAIVAKWHVDPNGNSKILVHCQAKRKAFFTSVLTQELKRRNIHVNHDTHMQLAAEKFANELDWQGPRYGRMVMGNLPDGSYVFVFTNEDNSPKPDPDTWKGCV